MERPSAEHPRPESAHLEWWTAGICMLVVAAGAALVASPNPVDDAGFFFRYAANVAAGDGFTFNPGEDPTMGVSSILWCSLLSLFAWMGFPPDQAHLPLGIF